MNINGFAAAFQIVGTVLCAGEIASACNCPQPPAPKVALQQATSVFLGKVVVIRKMPGVIGGKKVPFACFQALFRVERVWKGVSGTSAFVTTSPSETSCGYNFKVGGRYFVYADKAKGQKYLSTGLCSRTMPLSAAQGDLAALGKGKAPAQKQSAEAA